MQLISLITDYGIHDHYQAELKAALYKRCKDVVIMDINQNVPLHDISLAAYQLKNVMLSSPDNSIFIVGVNNQYSLRSRYICFEKEGNYFIGPDNGVFSLVFEDFEQVEVYVISNKNKISMDVHDLYAHAAACVNHGLPLSELGDRAVEVKRMIKFMPVVTKTQIRGTIIHIDHFENVITNLDKSLFVSTRNGRNFSLYYNPHDPLDIISNNYSDVAVGEVLCHFNGAGLLEIAINQGRASSLLNLNRNETIQIDFY